MNKILGNLQKIDAEITRANYNYKDGYFIDEVNKQLLTDTIEQVKDNVVKSNVIDSVCPRCSSEDLIIQKFHTENDCNNCGYSWETD